ncbi:MAG: DUF3616 domain-containing protein [Verrucomicrobia bacterium]|nr:DUF3616 domain-containing protein [Verrucomicrobiota bacterium]
MRVLAFLFAAILVSASAAESFKLSAPRQFQGMCSASGAVALDEKHFAVADDEGNQIRIYHNQRAGMPLKTIDLTSFLELDARHAETDLEGAARIGDRIYWIGSHGRNPEGKVRPSRQRFFATDISGKKNQFDLAPAGRPYKGLLTDLSTEPKFKSFHFEEAALRSPKQPGALNIEALAAAPDGHLLIGFRNPIPEGRALIIPLLNPDEVIAGKRPRFGEALRPDLDGLGIRDMAYVRGGYLIIGGHFDGQGHSKLFRWSGGDDQPSQLDVKHFKQFNPEAMVTYPKRGWDAVQVLSDDGSLANEGQRCKDQKDPRAQSFRSFWVSF